METITVVLISVRKITLYYSYLNEMKCMGSSQRIINRFYYIFLVNVIMEYTLNLLERPYEAIKNGTKNVEVRPNKEGSIVNNMKSGDIVIFKKCGTEEKQLCMIRRITLYSDVKELLIAEGTNNTLSSGIESILSIPGYRENIEKYGVFAILFSVIQK